MLLEQCTQLLSKSACLFLYLVKQEVIESLLTRDKVEKCKQVKIKLFCKRKTNLHCHTLLLFLFIGSFTKTCLGLFFLFFRNYPATRQRILKISLSRIFFWCNLTISKFRYLELFVRYLESSA